MALTLAAPASADDLDQLRARGELRHMGEPYANFITGAGDGLSVEVMKAFAAHLKVRYRFVPTTWGTAIGDLLGRKISMTGGEAVLGEPQPVRGDVWAGGVTVLPWRQKVMAFSQPTFPNQVWLVARADVKVEPIKPSGDPGKDAAQVKNRLKHLSVLCVPGTCLDGRQYQLDQAGAKLIDYTGKVSDIVAVVVQGQSQALLQDAPDAMVSLQKWPGQLKVIGPVSPVQQMAAAFAPSSPRLRGEFNRFLTQLKRSGRYRAMAQKYYPAVVDYFPEFFAQER
ncbi:MAG: transporter substrate-binding domain-containing protein [Proteobacteria bacterium]|nr:transporter substrate-binding domain-containing protein [Pseudomonadota bacterium]MBU4576189.1 transporter substrate-binding domain-containing protein [Pseudomonadota bacterium]MBU4598896.1 transporter substrate-binding domain-containing protein [Pseudomonadota bacterium]